MRIVFKPIQQSNINERYLTLNEFNVVDKIFPYYYHCFDNLTINWLDSFSDNSRYLLDIYEVSCNRCYSSKQASYDLNLAHDCKIIVIELTLNFDFNFDFKLFNDSYVDIWNNDLNIKLIKPLITTSFNDKQSPYLAFKSLATSYFTKILNLLGRNIICEKRDNKIIFAYLINNKDDQLDIVLNLFIDAIYEMVKSFSGRLENPIPEIDYQNKINIKSWYDQRRKKHKCKKDISVLNY